MFKTNLRHMTTLLASTRRYRKLSLLVAITLASFTMKSHAADSNEECSKTIVTIPQIHSTHEAQENAKWQEADPEMLENQLKIYHFLKEQDNRIPIFSEALGDKLSGSDMQKRLRDSTFVRGPISATKADQLSQHEKVMLATYSAAVGLFVGGVKDKIYGVAPSGTEHNDLHKEIREILARMEGGATLTQDELNKIFFVREQWALIQVLKWFSNNPEMPYAFLIYGSAHDFSRYEKYLPKGYCIGAPEIFDNLKPLRLPFNDAPLLTDFIKQSKWPTQSGT